MFIVKSDALIRYRISTFRLQKHLRLRRERDAVHFINECGFVSFWPIKNFSLPSIWGATAGDRPVSDNHDDAGHITWRWKDNLLGKKKCYYGRILRRRNTFISLAILPCFYALSPNYGDPESDYLIQYEQGLLPIEAKMVYEAILHEGALDTLSLKRAARLSSPGNEGRFNRALDILQSDFRILPIGIAEVGAWHYAFIYEAVHRHLPDLITSSHDISEIEAGKNILWTYLKTVGACTSSEPEYLFRWGNNKIKKVLNNLVTSKSIIIGKSESTNQINWLIHPNFVAQSCGFK